MNEEMLVYMSLKTQALWTVLYVHSYPKGDEQSRDGIPFPTLCKEVQECGQLYRNLVEAKMQLGGPHTPPGVLGPIHVPS